jgi:hypothetical protein
MVDATLDEFCHCGAPAADCAGSGPEHDARIAEHMARQSEDAILARVLRRFLAPTGHPSQHPFVDVSDEDLTLDGHVDLVPGDADVLRRVAGTAVPGDERSQTRRRTVGTISRQAMANAIGADLEAKLSGFPPVSPDA